MFLKKRAILSTIPIFLFIIYLVYAGVDTVTLNSPENATWSLTGNITFNCTGTPSIDVNVTNVTFYIYNSTGADTYNSSINTSDSPNGTAATRTYTISNIPEAEGFNYTWNCLVEDNTSNTSWASANLTFGVDLTPPAPSILTPSNASQDRDGTVTFIYNVSDNSSITNCTLFISGAADQTNTTVVRDTNLTFTKESISSTNALEWFISCYDLAGRQGNTSKYYLDTVRISESSGGGYGGRTYKEGEVTNAEISLKVKSRDNIRFSYLGNEHELKVVSLSSSKISLKIYSDPIELELPVGTSSLVDLDGDNEKDIKITFEGLEYSKAILTIENYIAPKTKLETPSEVTNQQEESGDVAAEVTQPPVESPADKTDTTWAWILGILVVGIIVLYFVTKKKK